MNYCCIVVSDDCVPGGLLWPAAAVAIAKAEAGDTEQREFSVAGTEERINTYMYRKTTTTDIRKAGYMLKE